MLTALLPILALVLAPTAHAAEDAEAPLALPAASTHEDPAPPVAPVPVTPAAPAADEARQTTPPPPAAPLAAPASVSADAHETVDDSDDNSSPLYIGGRGSIAVPANGNGDVMAAGAGMGILFSDSQQFGLRFIYMHQPPSNPLATDTPAVPWAWGPVLDWQWTVRPESRASIFLASSLGYVYGTPKDGVSDNVILPILEGGVGLRLSKKLQDGTRLYIAPQLGFVPGAVAPFSALDIGMILPGGKRR
jgi:hypothetical protein